MASYRHTQVGTITLALLGLFCSVPILLLRDEETVLLAAITLVVVLLAAALFGTLTVRVNYDSIECFLGVGAIQKRIPLESITAVKRVRNKWWYGFGIRHVSTGWMWNVSGLDALLLTLSNGKQFRIGTDEPERLRTAIVDAARLK